MINPLLNNAWRARITIIINWTLATIQAAAIVSDFMQARLLNQFNLGNIDYSAAESNDSRQKLIVVVYLIVLLLSIIFFIMWFRRAYCNLQRTERVNLKYSEGWAAGAWFVPFLNLYRPYEIMKEIWHKTQEATFGLVLFKKGTLVGWWWLIYIVSNTLSYISFRTERHPQSIDGLISSTYFEMVVRAVDILSILITIVMITQASQLETKLYASYSLPIEEGEDKLADIII